METKNDLLGATQWVVNRTGMEPIFLTSKASTRRAWNIFATTWRQNKENCLPGMVGRLWKPNKRSEDCGWIPKWRKGASCSWRLFLSCPDILGSCPPLPYAIFISRAGIRMLSALDGWRDPLTHHNSGIRTSLLLDNFQGGFTTILWCHSCTILGGRCSKWWV